MSDVWVPGNLVDLEALKREYDTVVFTRAAVRKIEYTLSRMTTLLDVARFDEADVRLLDNHARSLIEEAEDVLVRLREVL